MTDSPPPADTNDFLLAAIGQLTAALEALTLELRALRQARARGRPPDPPEARELLRRPR